MVISVGNVAVGGTGKTPMVEYLIAQLADRYELSTLSRGYGRKTRGFRMADKQDTAGTLGDEPYQIFRKYGHKVHVTVGEERILAIPSIVQEFPSNDIILLDDAFQHRPVKPNFSIVLSDYNRPFYNDYLMPSGLLRESRNGVNRADVLIITKCPDTLSEEDQIQIRKGVAPYYDTAKTICFTTIAYNVPQSFDSDNTLGEDVAVVTGIANPAPFISKVNSAYNIKHHFKYRDHYSFNDKDVQTIASFLDDNDCQLLTTEKDMVRLMNHPRYSELLKGKCFYLPIKVQFLSGEKEFLNDLQTAISANEKESKGN